MQKPNAIFCAIVRTYSLKTHLGPIRQQRTNLSVSLSLRKFGLGRPRLTNFTIMRLIAPE